MEKPAIRLEKLVLRNYKGFYTGDDEKGIEINFDPNLTVFIGDNGAGKSAVLDAIALFLAKLREEITLIGDSSIYPFPPLSREKKNKSVNNHSEVERAQLDAFFKLSPTPIWEDENEALERKPQLGLTLEMLKAKSPQEIQVSKWFDHSKLGDEELDTTTNDKRTLEYFLRDNVYDVFLKGDFKNKEKDRSIPILIYYGANTINMGIGTEIEEVDDSVFDAYQDALNANEFSFKQFFAWYDSEKKKLMQKIKNGKAKITDTPNAYIAKAIEEMLSNQKYRYAELDIDWSNYPHDMTLMKYNGNVKEAMGLSIGQLSSGERTLIALVADLTRRLCLANPNADNPLEGNGIVLIDEIDVHLHPKWQQKVVMKLRAIFPNIQFVLTTHSPEVLKRLDRQNLRIIKDGQVFNKVPYIKGRDNNSIIRDAFGTHERIPEYEEKLSEFYKYVDSENIEVRQKARKILDDLKNDWGDIDLEIQRAESYYEIF